MSSINYVWRVFATGFCFAMFSIGGLLLSFILLPIQRLFVINPNAQKQLARKTVHLSFKLFVQLMTFVGVLETRIIGKEKLSNINGMVIIANHPSLIDVVVLIACVPQADCVIKSSLFENYFIKRVLENTGYIRNDDPEQLISDCKKSLSQGNNIIIFPEGTRTVPNEQIKFMRGAANIAIRCKADYLPVLINVAPTTLTKSESWYQIPDKKVTLMLEVLPAMVLSEYWHSSNTALSVRELTQKSQHFYIQELLKYEH